MKHLVAISGGKDSTAMALRLAELDADTYEFCITPTGRELPEMEAHWAKLECLLRQPLIKVPAPTFNELVRDYQALPNWRMRWCTREIKIRPFQVYAAARKPATVYVGLRADEYFATYGREGTDWTAVDGVKQALPMVDWGWGINDVLGYLAKRGVEVPERTDCDLCFFQRLAEWWRLWKNYPDRYAEAEALEEWTGHTLRSDGRDSWPASLRELRLKFEAGFVPKGANQLSLRLEIQDRPSMCAWCAR